jgi:hypothetical protein
LDGPAWEAIKARLARKHQEKEQAYLAQLGYTAE